MSVLARASVAPKATVMSAECISKSLMVLEIKYCLRLEGI